MDSVKGARWLARQTPNILCYLITSEQLQEIMASQFASLPTSEEIIQINFFVVYIISLF